MSPERSVGSGTAAGMPSLGSSPVEYSSHVWWFRVCPIVACVPHPQMPELLRRGGRLGEMPGTERSVFSGGCLSEIVLEVRLEATWADTRVGGGHHHLPGAEMARIGWIRRFRLQGLPALVFRVCSITSENAQVRGPGNGGAQNCRHRMCC
ncbi:uncharacterized protein B0I36DRAFT_12253 [Microdochium trichocladiopsis]|uniref:Uncharacterized protein n=1 Tax=Microdochium trichocladiopsis TaxID=1682393 RepID=A0A9P8YEZ3_9PEZI|nr:uncharacterized protein B0I36DRAFT_12253 [Microdochium trichocladiopsis]KAH7040547.1 hypothetical protein B0I36DRAFT_12253 [Microdochium trichocladiopsis]